MNIFVEKRKVVSSEIDEYNHVNNVVYVQWIQDVADAHWKLLIKDVPKPDYVWFVVRHEINYKGQAKLDDEVTITTWIGKTEGVKSIRHVEIKKGEELLVKSETTFCLLDAKTQRPRRVTKEVTDLLLPRNN